MKDGLLWAPDKERQTHTLLAAFIRAVNQDHDTQLSGYDDLYAWSVRQSGDFWQQLWQFAGVIGDPGERVCDIDPEHPNRDSQWFPTARLNYAENLLKHAEQYADQPAMIFSGEHEVARTLTWRELVDQVAAIRHYLDTQGVQPGDVVAGYLPNLPETVIAMLATAALGAIWTSTSPDFGVDSVLDRFGQTEPKVLFTTDHYHYNGKTYDCLNKAQQVVDNVPAIERLVVIPFDGDRPSLPAGVDNWQDLLTNDAPPLRFTRVAFNAPLFVLYSSGTTGKPKCIIHSVGGILLNHLKEHQLHSDVRPGDRFFYFTTCGWMMWNWQVSALASGATLVLYDGSPFYPDAGVLWRLAERHQITLFGTAAKYLEALEKQGVAPKEDYSLASLRVLCSTGSVLAPEQFDYVYQKIKSDLQLSSIAGGTDICGCFVLGSPLSPVYRGESQKRGLALDVQVFNAQGQAVEEQKGELVCCNSFPNQPVGFWHDTDGSRYHNAYWNKIDDIWFHGDYVRLTAQGGMVFYGRSDAVLNPGGVRIGTAEIYRHVNQLSEIMDSVVIGQQWQNDVRVVLFVKLAAGVTLDESLKQTIKKTIRTQCTPRHVPAVIAEVSDIPRTKSGKLAELAVRDVVHGQDVAQLSALDNPASLDQYRQRPELTE
ncbi:acetoacetate--CoA ligase [Salinivibrio sp. ML290]|uniref:acetoacetate--CoA ligase n=1 Tax=Salinivibrio sp. ML290 TaxID=1909468 RepID=UPI000988443E|nr:acetoacetate--CoA ligase [Salinivibrio sp. ML290]OOE72412.1 acetoacetate--CoA ligase [Salinivibrio sp. ML290]